MTKIKYIILTIILLVGKLTHSQQNIDNEKLEYVFKLSQCFLWPDTESKFEVKIWLFGCTPEMETDFDYIIQDGFIDGTQVTKVIPASINDIKDVHVVFVHAGRKDFMNEIYEKLSNKPILIITDGLEGTNKGMVNFNIVNGKVNYEIDKQKIISAGLRPSMRMQRFDGDEKLLEEFYSEKEIEILRRLQEELGKSALQKKQLIKYKQLATRQKSQMTDQNRRVKHQRNKIAFQNVELSEQQKKYEKLKGEVANLQKTIDLKINILKKQEFEIIKQEKKISVQQEQVESRTNLLKDLSVEIDSQQIRIARQKQYLARQNTTIQKQQDILYIFIVFIIFVLILAFLIYRGYKIKKEVNKKLEEKNIAINKQKHEILTQSRELELTNKELEKLSIVASETDNAIRIMDRMGNYEWINDGYTRMYGLTLEQLAIRSGNIISANTTSKVRKAVHECLTKKRSIIFESLAENLNGEDKIWAQTTLTPILDRNGEVKKLIAIDSNISKLKEAEAEIKQQKEEIEAQRDEIEMQRDYANQQKQKITDSIVYAKRIQAAILPPNEVMDKILPDHFVLFKPRDIVSGDFYWITQKENKIIVAAADCTGHGVPGAFMSMLGIAYLNEIVNKMMVNKHIYSLQANEILNELRNYVISSLHQTGKRGEATDGMDISLCIIDPEKKELQYAGAHNPLFIIRDNELIQIKGDKMPIGIHRRSNKKFTNHEIEYQEDDIIYMFSDGYTDQIGGEFRRKFNSSPFRQLLLEIKDEPMRRQQEVLGATIEDWKGDIEQIDDILVMGVKLKFDKPQKLEPVKYNWNNKKILIAEDMELNYILLVNALEKTGVEIIRAKNGIEAVEICKDNNDIDLILMDIDMPRMNGVQATAEIRKFNSDIPIIAQTALNLPEEKNKSLKAGCNEHITKPIKLVVFLEKLSKFLGE